MCGGRSRRHKLYGASKCIHGNCRVNFKFFLSENILYMVLYRDFIHLHLYPSSLMPKDIAKGKQTKQTSMS